MKKRVLHSNPDDSPSWAGDQVRHIDGHTVRIGRFANKSRWAVDLRHDNSGPFADTPEMAVSAYGEAVRLARQENERQSKVNEALANIQNGRYSDADLSLLFGGYKAVRRSHAMDVLRSLGLNPTNRKNVITRTRELYVDNNGDARYAPADLIRTARSYL